MKRLPEPYDVTDPNEDYASSLLKHARPLEPSSARKRRVWSALERSAMKRPRHRVSGPLVAALVLCGATAASATMPRLWARFHATPVVTEVAPEAPAAVETRRTKRRRAVPAAAAGSAETADLDVPIAEIPVAEPPATEAPPGLTVQPAAPATVAPTVGALSGPNAAAGAKKGTSAKGRVAVADPVDPPASAALMVEAMRERRAGNVARARELSAEYRAKYPGGALQEESFALSIEAAAALGDDEARRLAATYLQRYPHGRFRAQAERVVGSSR